MGKVVELGMTQERSCSSWVVLSQTLGAHEFTETANFASTKNIIGAKLYDLCKGRRDY